MVRKTKKGIALTFFRILELDLQRLQCSYTLYASGNGLGDDFQRTIETKGAASTTLKCETQ